MKKRVWAVVTLVCLLLSACGSAEQTVGESTIPEQSAIDTEEPEKRWTLREIKLPDGNAALAPFFAELYPESDALERNRLINDRTEVLYMGLTENTVYRYVSVSDEIYVTHYCIQTMEAPYTEWETKIIPAGNENVKIMNGWRKNIYFSPEGELSTALMGGAVDWYREVISPDGAYLLEMIPREDMSELLKDADSLYMHAGKDYAYTSDGLMCFQENFAVSEVVGYQNSKFIQQMTETPSGEDLYLFGASEDGAGLGIWSADSKEPVILEDIGFNIARSYMKFTSETEGYLCDADKLWQFSVTEGSVEQLEVFQEHVIYDLKEIKGLFPREDGSLLILAATGDGYSLIDRSERQVTEKTLELVTFGADLFLKEAIVQFNNENDDYEIVLCERPEEEYYEDYQTRIQAEISGGGGPDLIATSILNIEEGAARGFLRDLTQDFGEEKEAVVESVMQSGIVDGRIYAIPYSFTVETMVTGEHIVGDRTGWTLEEAMQITRESGIPAMGLYINSPTLFRYLGFKNENNSHLIDWENGTCKLDSEEVIELLEFSAEYGEDRDLATDAQAAMDAGERWSSSDRLINGEALAEVYYIFGIDDIQDMENLYGARNSRPVLIGFPVESGKSGHSLVCDGIAVNQSCEYPEGAIAFLRYLQSEETQGKIVEHISRLGSGFPVRRDSLNQVFDKGMKGEYDSQRLVVLGEEIEAEPVSREMVEELWNVIETAEPRSNRIEKVLVMIDEETAPFFAGERSAQEVLDILQNRVQLYLDEIN